MILMTHGIRTISNITKQQQYSETIRLSSLRNFDSSVSHAAMIDETTNTISSVVNITPMLSSLGY